MSILCRCLEVALFEFEQSSHVPMGLTELLLTIFVGDLVTHQDCGLELASGRPEPTPTSRGFRPTGLLPQRRRRR